MLYLQTLRQHSELNNIEILQHKLYVLHFTLYIILDLVAQLVTDPPHISLHMKHCQVEVQKEYF